jgi:DNA-binding PadR family transcriptional regulator
MRLAFTRKRVWCATGARAGHYGRAMSLKHAVLALVVERRGYGYDLAHRLEERVGPAWRLNPSAVYPAIDQLERAGLVSGAARSRAARSTRVVYSATRAGAEALDAWLCTPDAPPEPIRSDLHLRIAFAGPEHRGALLEQLALQERAYAELVDRYERAHQPGVHELLAGGVLARVRAELRWLHEARAAIAAGALGDGS